MGQEIAKIAKIAGIAKIENPKLSPSSRGIGKPKTGNHKEHEGMQRKTWLLPTSEKQNIMTALLAGARVP